jgi:hypothetical protein
MDPAEALHARLDHVGELRARLLGENLAVATGALTALRELAEDRSRPVAAAARVALDEATLRADPATVDFGRVSSDAIPPPRRVRLSGPPIASRFTAEPSASWIRVGTSTTGLHIAVSVKKWGRFDGEVVVTAPTGDLRIPVRLEVDRQPASIRPSDEDEPPRTTSPVTRPRAGAPPAANIVRPDPPAAASRAVSPPADRGVRARRDRAWVAGAVATVLGSPVVVGLFNADWGDRPGFTAVGILSVLVIGVVVGSLGRLAFPAGTPFPSG